MTNIVDVQTATELSLSKAGIRTRLEGEIARDGEVMEAMFEASMALYRWSAQHDIDLGDEPSLVVHEAMLLVMALDERRELISALAGQLSHLFERDDKADAIELANRVLVVLADADLFDIEYVSYDDEDEETGQMITEEYYYITNPWEVSDTTAQLMQRAMFLPPMVCKPAHLTHNRSNPLLTGEDKSLILGKFNHHDGDICLDTLNIANGVAMSLSIEMLKGITDSLLIPKKLQVELKRDPKRKEQYDKFMRDSADVYAYLVKNGNRFYLTHKPDKRGRKYASGYHANTQGDVFRKSIVELHNKEVVDGF
ncbi:RNA polymerase protein [Vibrio phage vB_VspP_pVa5]|uniref:RNA polymerase protein n=1 Tax=Vibrio phage vB_VspP_pVa5 TaxID=1913109 RepID=A0A1J0GV31_9CAUD|nr:RNA polymerase protein [Vibrio phage vB_VspP_pVa5]APC46039.1 RNA polymerase protein [Vibrio phage vB_VspP_pVa5]